MMATGMVSHGRDLSPLPPAATSKRKRPWWLSGTPVVTAVVVAAVFVVWPMLASGYWVQASTSAAAFAMAALGVSVLVGRVGLISLGQVALVATGAWIALRLGYGTGLPFPVIVFLAGVGTGVVGLVIGLPSLWLSGLTFAVLTLMGAAAITLVLTVISFPNGGGGLTGFASTGDSAPMLERPMYADSDADYFRLALVIAVLMFALVLIHLNSRAGRAWEAIRQSPAAAIGTGIDVVRYKLWAILLASFIAGVAGAVMAGAGGIRVTLFPVQDSIIIVAAVLMAGAFSLWGAIVAAVLMKFLGAAFTLLDVSSSLLLILFGAGIIQVLLQSPQGIVGQLQGVVARRRRRDRTADTGQAEGEQDA